MKLSNKMQRFPEPTLLVVSSPAGSIFYVVEGEEIRRVAQFRIEKPQFSDSEDFEAGPQIDRTKSIVLRDFKIQFEDTAKNLSKKLSVKRLYLFTSNNISNLLERLLPRDWKNCLAGHQRGDFTKVHPLQILKKVAV